MLLVPKENSGGGYTWSWGWCCESPCHPVTPSLPTLLLHVQGGIGTFDEVCDMACQKQLGMNWVKVLVLLLLVSLLLASLLLVSLLLVWLTISRLLVGAKLTTDPLPSLSSWLAFLLVDWLTG